MEYYQKLLQKALDEIDSNGGKANLVCGLLATSSDSFQKNHETFKKHIQLQQEAHGYVFNQLPYLDVVCDGAPCEYDKKFDIFYQGLIQSGKITKLFIIPGWEESPGTKSEISYAQKHGIPVTYLQ